MTIPRWMLSLLTLGAAAVGALVTVLTISYRAGEKVTQLTVELSHVSGMLAPALASVASHETRLTVAELQIKQCCPGVAPKLSLAPIPTATGAVPATVASRGVW